MNTVSDIKQLSVIKLLLEGCSLRHIASTVGVSQNTVWRYQKLYVPGAICKCGKPARQHRGSCSARLRYLPKRQAWLRSHGWLKRQLLLPYVTIPKCEECGRGRVFGFGRLCDECHDDIALLSRLKFENHQADSRHIAEMMWKLKVTSFIPYPTRSLDREHQVGDNSSTLHSITGSHYPSPLDELIQKEEREEEQKYKRYQERKHRPIPVYKPRDFEEDRLSALIATAPQKLGNRGKFAGEKITKVSPERGVTQRHIKMSPQQFV